MGLRQVLAVGAVALVEVGHGVEAEAVHAEVQPEAQRLEHRLLDLGVVEVEVRLVGEEAVPEVGAGLLVPGPVGRLGVGEDDPRLLVAVHGVRPHVPVALGRVGRGAGLLEPRVVGGGVVHHEVGDHADAALVGGLDEVAHVVDGPVVGLDREVVRDVVAAVAQRGPVEGQQPDAVDAQPLQVVELLGQPAEVAGAVAVGVEERAGVDLVEDRRLEPQRRGLEPVSGIVGAGHRGSGVYRSARPQTSPAAQTGVGSMRCAGSADASGGRRRKEMNRPLLGRIVRSLTAVAMLFVVLPAAAQADLVGGNSFYRVSADTTAGST